MNDQGITEAEPAGADGAAPLSISKATKRFGDTAALQAVTASIREHEVVTLIGPSGSGKSTLLRSIAALETLDSGEVSFGDELLNAPGLGTRKRSEAALPPERRSRIVGMVFQNFELFPHMTAVENVAAGLIHVRRTSKADARETARRQLDAVGLGAKHDSYPSQLSGGQQQRVGIARALAMSPRVMLFDEPTSALDPETVDEVLTTMRGLRDSGMTMLIATHEMEFARDVSDRTIFMEGGEVVEMSDSRVLFTQPRTERCRAFLRKFLSNA